MAKILVVDDEATLVETLKYNLLREGYEVVTAGDGVIALQMVRDEKPDAVILDVMLPGLDGFEVCRRLRQQTLVPILMLTAKDEEVDRVVGLELGADDYITKPFSLRELLARVKAVLRRSSAQIPMRESDPRFGADAQVLTSGDLCIDLGRREVTRGSERLSLKPKEYDLLVFFVRNRGQVLSREMLLEKVWGYDYAGGTRTVDVHVRWLREKVESDPGSPRRIVTVRSVGYRFEG